MRWKSLFLAYFHERIPNLSAPSQTNGISWGLGTKQGCVGVPRKPKKALLGTSIYRYTIYSASDFQKRYWPSPFTWNFQNWGKFHWWPKVHKIILNLTLYFVFQNFCNKSPFWTIFFRSPLDLRKTAHGKKTTSIKGGLRVKIWFRDQRESF